MDEQGIPGRCRAAEQGWDAFDSSALWELFKMRLHFVLNKQSIAWAWLSFLFPEEKIGTFSPANTFIV